MAACEEGFLTPDEDPYCSVVAEPVDVSLFKSLGLVRRLVPEGKKTANYSGINTPEQTVKTGMSITKECEMLFNSLRKLLRCTVCFDIQNDCNQCRNGHLICQWCTTRLEQRVHSTSEATCPICRVQLQPGLSRCLLVQQLTSELPVPCSYCKLYFPQLALHNHETCWCKLRPTACRYAVFGCPWRGSWCEQTRHQESCSFPSKKVCEIEDTVFENVYQNNTSVEHRDYAFTEVLHLLDGKPGGLILSLKKVILQKRVRKSGNLEMHSNSLCFTGTTSVFSKLDSRFTSLDVLMSNDIRRLQYSIKFSSHPKKILKFKVISVTLGNISCDVIDQFHTTFNAVNGPSTIFNCSLQYRDETGSAFSRNLSDQYHFDSRLSSMRLNILLIHENNQCCISTPPIEIHEWSQPESLSTTPARSETTTSVFINNPCESQIIHSHSRPASTFSSANQLPSYVTHTIEENQLRQGTYLSVWEVNPQRAVFSTEEQHDLPINSRQQFSVHEAISNPDTANRSHSLDFNNDFSRMSNNNAIIDTDYDEQLAPNARAVVPSSDPRTQHEIRKPKIANKRSRRLAIHAGTQTIGKKPKRVEKRVRKQCDAIKTPPTTASGLFKRVQQIAPYMSRIHLAVNLQMIAPKVKLKRTTRNKSPSSSLKMIKKTRQQLITKSRSTLSQRFHQHDLFMIKILQFSPRALIRVSSDAILSNMKEFWHVAQQRSARIVVRTKQLFGFRPANLLQRLTPRIQQRLNQVARTVGAGAMQRSDEDSLNLRQNIYRPDTIALLTNFGSRGSHSPLPYRRN